MLSIESRGRYCEFANERENLSRSTCIFVVGELERLSADLYQPEISLRMVV